MATPAKNEHVWKRDLRTCFFSLATFLFFLMPPKRQKRLGFLSLLAFFFFWSSHSSQTLIKHCFGERRRWSQRTRHSFASHSLSHFVARLCATRRTIINMDANRAKSPARTKLKVRHDLVRRYVPPPLPTNTHAHTHPPRTSSLVHEIVSFYFFSHVPSSPPLPRKPTSLGASTLPRVYAHADTRAPRAPPSLTPLERTRADAQRARGLGRRRGGHPPGLCGL